MTEELVKIFSFDKMTNSKEESILLWKLYSKEWLKKSQLLPKILFSNIHTYIQSINSHTHEKNRIFQITKYIRV